MTMSVLIKRSHLHRSHVHSEFLPQLTTHFTATLTGCKWPWRQLSEHTWQHIWCSAKDSGQASFQKPSSHTTPELVSVNLLSLQQATVASGVVLGLFSIGSLIFCGRSATGFSAAQTLIPWRANFAWLKLDSQKIQPYFGQQSSGLLYLSPSL